MNKEEAKKILSPEAYAVAVEGGTEYPFSSPYWNLMAEGLYVDALSGKPLFSSKDKFLSSCGWPAFSRPIDPKAITSSLDESHHMIREEVRSASSSIHLGHVFYGEEGTPNGVRYCINGVSLRFIRKEDLEKEGYGDYLPLFK
jgi:peptide-methionine (R)-S-oxide reductase